MKVNNKLGGDCFDCPFSIASIELSSTLGGQDRSTEDNTWTHDD